MFKIARHVTTLRILAAILFLLVLLPAVFFTSYEFSSLTQSEGLIDKMYRQQLDAALFSLNQYAWDIADGWAREVNRILQSQTARASHTTDDFTAFLSSKRGIRALFVADTAGTSLDFTVAGYRDSASSSTQGADLLTLIRLEQGRVSRLSQLERAGYRKIEGVTIHSDHRGASAGLIFIVRTSDGHVKIAVIELNAESFVRYALRQKLDEIASNEFILSVTSKSDGRQIYATGTLAPGEERQTKDLWLFPGYSLGIRLRGQTIEEVVRDRFYRNLALLGLLDVMILAGVWFVYRTVRREMQLARMQSDFVSSVSHELRTPLSLIRMFAETLEMGRVQSEERKQEYYATIVRETERLTGLINNVLSFSRMESGRKAYQLAQADLNGIVEKVLSSYRPHISHLGFTLEIAIAASLPNIMADTEAVSEALLNIIDNALKYGRDKKWIRVTTGQTKLSVYVDVEDRGIGIEDRDQARIFEKFYRVSNGFVHEIRGSGLGLTLVRHIMDAHNGEVTVSSRIGEGSTFRLSFPAAT